MSHSDKKAEKGAIYENIFGGNCGGTIGANAAQKRNRGMIRRRKTSNLLNKSISDTQLAFICANLADSLVFFSENNLKTDFGNRVSENDKNIQFSVYLFSKLLNIRKRKRRISRCRLSLNPRCFPVLAPLATRKRRVQIFALS